MNNSQITNCIFDGQNRNGKPVADFQKGTIYLDGWYCIGPEIYCDKIPWRLRIACWLLKHKIKRV